MFDTKIIPKRPVRVVVMSPPLSRSGGIGTLYNYARPYFSDAVTVRFIDTRGLRKNPAYSLPHLGKALAVVTLLRMFNRVDVVHFNFGARGAAIRKMSLLAWCSYVLRLPSVAQLHTSTFEEYVLSLPRFARNLLLSTLNRANEILVLGAVWEEMLIRLGIIQSKIEILVMGVSSIRRDSTSQDRKHLDVLFAGDLVERKGLPQLLSAVIEPGLTSVRLIVAGSGDLRPWRIMCEELEISDRVALLGWVSNNLIHEILADIDVMILPSRHEGLPVSVLEGLSAGVCVLATPVGALPEVLNNRGDSLFIDELSSHAIANALREVTDIDYRKALAHGGLNTWTEKFDVRVTTPKLEEHWIRAYVQHLQ